ncbi:MAG TPA: hypothetical protein VEB22_10040 [Phycisphaerales bacterium]|nr:hypothetical protein [Phycisphaerales bacterium]
MVLLLEDDAARLDSLLKAASRVAPNVAVRVWNDAHLMIRKVGTFIAAARAISLDHDLIAPAGASDPGDGLAVARFLVSQPAKRP